MDQTLNEKYQEELKKMDEKDYGKKFEEEFAKIRNNVKKPNILLAGATGVGKSTLVNMIFGKEVAIVGTGNPVTQEIDVYESDDVDVRIFDSKGYELGDEADKEFYQTVVGLAQATRNPMNTIHLIWYCIQCPGGRVTDYDLAAINAFHEARLPVAIVFTKSDICTEEELNKLKQQLPAWTNDQMFETSDRSPNLDHSADLVTWSILQLPEALRDALIKSQKNNPEEKWKRAHIIIAQHAAAAFGTGFIPIPGSDAPILVANEIALMARVMYLYDLGSLSDMLKTAGLSAIIGPLLTTGGKSLASSFLKLLPVVGWVAGGLISGAVGATVTFAFGEATSAVSYGICKAKWDGDDEQVNDLIEHFGKYVLDLAKQFLLQGKTKKDDYKKPDAGWFKKKNK